MDSTQSQRFAAIPDDGGERWTITLVSDPEWETPLEKRLRSALHALRSYGLRAVTVQPGDNPGAE